MIKKTLGGDRLGSGNKMKVALHNYERSTHDLGNVWRSSMTCGVLVPFYKKICMNGDTWSINLKSLVRTMPAIGPCFGSYKLQMDVFEIPIRLYNGVLHNNMTKIGMDMAKVKFPKITLTGRWEKGTSEAQNKNYQVASDSLMCYLGLRGIGSASTASDVERDFNAVPLLAYYDIFKNYYSNKQEEYAYVIDNEVQTSNDGALTNLNVYTIGRENYINTLGLQTANTTIDGTSYNTISLRHSENDYTIDEALTFPDFQRLFDSNGRNKMLNLQTGRTMIVNWTGNINTKILLKISHTQMNEDNEPVWGSSVTIPIDQTHTINGTPYNLYETEWQDKKLIIIPQTQVIKAYLDSREYYNIYSGKEYYTDILFIPTTTKSTNTYLKPFKLENIDTMRIEILRNTALNTTFYVNEENLYPYKAVWEVKEDGQSGTANTMQGLCLKTYQNDIFNCWLSSNWIDGIRGINEISAIAVEDGVIKIDAINLKKKVYNMLNRIAVSGGTYEDWQEAVYGEDALRRAESPIYSGGMSGIIAFEEVVSTADTQTTTAGDQPLGSLAGKGTLTNVQGGNIEIHVKEPSYIMGIVSITPYVDYCNGNDFDLTELDSINDLHKPELDEIGWQDLMMERAAWWANEYQTDTEVWTKPAGGKQPAWLEYMTSVNQVYGDFANIDKAGWMVLNRDYEIGRHTVDNSQLDNSDPLKYSSVKDWTTYVNPTKYNYQFANTKLEAQNFWVQIGINAIARRKISAKLIPNL